MATPDIRDTVSAFGLDALTKLSGTGEPEEALRTPIDNFLGAVGKLHGLNVVLDGEVHLSEIRSRPDFAIRVNGAVVGYLEVKAPGVNIEPSSFPAKSHNRSQWERLRGLPNLLYTNGTDWTLWRGGDEPVSRISLTGGPLHLAGVKLQAPAEFEQLLLDFLRWSPSPIKSVARLVRQVAPVTRMLREKVSEQLAEEAAQIAEGAPKAAQQFTGLASDWRALLFPEATDDEFANGYAQTVVFALLLARTEEIDLEKTSLYEIGQKLGSHHSLMGRALQLLTETVSGGFIATIDLLRRIIGAVVWKDVRNSKDTYLHLYEKFLEAYDPELRKATGTYYTPHQVVDEMVRLTDEAIESVLGLKSGFLNPAVTIVDPAVGTGTFLHSIIERSAEKVSVEEGAGAVPGQLRELAKRLVGFEIQLGSYAVAELRTTDLLRTHHVGPDDGAAQLFVTDALSDPYAAVQQLASGLGAISESKRRANEVKATVPVTVVIGNPPYGDNAEGKGGWIERRDDGSPAPLDAFRAPGNGRNERFLKNYYIYFWRWATWKVFESIPSDQAGVICFITPSAYLRGVGGKGMREYLRRNSDHGWVVELSPEGLRPDVRTRIFPGVAQPLAIGIFVRTASNDSDVPSAIRHMVLHGNRNEKFDALATLDLVNGWSAVRSGWHDAFTPQAADWDALPALEQLFQWRTPGIAAHRTWPISASVDVLADRWKRLRAATGARAIELFHNSRDSRWDRFKKPFLGGDVHSYGKSLAEEMQAVPSPIRYGFRSLDRQWIIPDHRLIHDGRYDLWSARNEKQLFVVEQHSEPLSNGPGLMFSALIPDMHHFNNRGGRVFPLRHPDGSSNTAHGLLSVLSERLGQRVDEDELVAYIAGVVSHENYVLTFVDELQTPGIRVPLTADVVLWRRAAEVGRKIIWLQTYGARADDAAAGRAPDDVRAGLSHDLRPLALEPVVGIPLRARYSDALQRIEFVNQAGAMCGAWGPVSRETYDYVVGGKRVVDSWLKYRNGKLTKTLQSDLDHVQVKSWPAAWTTEFSELLAVLTQLRELEETQAQLLRDILAAELLTTSALEAGGVRWPTPAEMRRAKPSLSASSEQLDVFQADDAATTELT